MKRSAPSVGRATRGLVVMGCIVAPVLAHAQVTTAARDSANVRVVENRIRGEVPVAFLLSPTPTVSFGGSSTDSLAELYSVSDAIRLPNGRFLVGVGGTARSIRMFDPAGRYLSTVARSGQGPGELPNTITSIVIVSRDTVAVASAPRVLLLDTEGRWLGSQMARGNSLTVFGGGALVTGRGAGGGSTIRLIKRVGSDEQPDTGVVLAAAPRTELVTLAVPAADGQPARTAFVIPPFVRSLSRAPTPSEGFVVGDGERFEIRVHDRSGVLRTIIRRDADLVIRPADIDGFRTTVVPEYQGARRAPIERWLAGLEHPPTKPAFSSLTVDRAGRIWAETFVAGYGFPKSYSVFEPDGRLLGMVALDRGLEPYDIGADYILVGASDADGFRHLRVHTLTPPR